MGKDEQREDERVLEIGIHVADTVNSLTERRDLYLIRGYCKASGG